MSIWADIQDRASGEVIRKEDLQQYQPFEEVDAVVWPDLNTSIDKQKKDFEELSRKLTELRKEMDKLGRYRRLEPIKKN